MATPKRSCTEPGRRGTGQGGRMLYRTTPCTPWPARGQHQQLRNGTGWARKGACGPKAPAGGSGPSCPSPDSCNAGAGCPVHLRLQEQHGRDTEQYLRAMLAEGPFHPFSKHASLNEVSARFGRDVPADYPLPVAPGHVRKAKHTCRRPGCQFKGTDRACRGGRECERRVQVLRGAEIPELQEEYQGEVPPHILWGEEEEAPEPPSRPPLEERIAQAFDGLDMDQDI